MLQTHDIENSYSWCEWIDFRTVTLYILLYSTYEETSKTPDLRYSSYLHMPHTHKKIFKIKILLFMSYLIADNPSKTNPSIFYRSLIQHISHVVNTGESAPKVCFLFLTVLKMIYKYFFTKEYIFLHKDGI